MRNYSKLFLLVLCLCVVVPVLSEAALCPPATATAVCADFGEPTGVTNLKDTVVTIKRDGVALPAITIPASSPTGGGVMSTSMPTIACQSDVYTAEAYSQYTTNLGVMKSLVVTSTPGLGVTKDRTGEAACFKVPENFSLH